MTIIVEDGGGRADATAYADIAYADGHHAQRGNDAWAAAAVPSREAALIRATDCLNAAWHYRGSVLNDVQALAWPRQGVEDDTGRTILGVPEAIKRACAELALKALTEELLPDQPRGGLIESESLGPMSMRYAAGAPAGTTRRLVEGLLRGLLRSGIDLARA